jgi:hypothetical protein
VKTMPQAAIDAPSAARRQHNRITRDRKQIADVAGRIGVPWRAEGLLAKLERNGSITAAQRAAGEQFHALFRSAASDPLKATDPSRTHVSGARALSQQLGCLWAKTSLDRAIDALGGLASPAGSCAWHVLGNDCSMQNFAVRQSWCGNPIRPEVAKGVLLSCLGTLQHHFRM